MSKKTAVKKHEILQPSAPVPQRAKAGDLCQLKSGGPVMTIEQIDGARVHVVYVATRGVDENYRPIWAEVCREVFPADVLDRMVKP